jgi:hypothetical protein
MRARGAFAAEHILTAFCHVPGEDALLHRGEEDVLVDRGAEQVEGALDDDADREDRPEEDAPSAT